MPGQHNEVGTATLGGACSISEKDALCSLDLGVIVMFGESQGEREKSWIRRVRAITMWLKGLELVVSASEQQKLLEVPVQDRDSKLDKGDRPEASVALSGFAA
ncbi:MAG: hypothetical protein ACLT9P_02080 [Evtepia gabavorous]